MYLVHILNLVYVSLVYIRPQEYIPALQDIPILQFFLIGSFFVWLLQPKRIVEAPQYWLFPVLLLLMCLSVAVNGWIGGAVNVFMDFAPVVALFFLISTSTNTASKHRQFMTVLTLATVILALHGIDQVHTGIGWSGARVIEGRITYLGVFNDPNDLALAFIIAIPMLFLNYNETKSLVIKVWWLSAIVIVLYGIYLTNSRGGMLGVIVLFMFFTYRRYGIFRFLLFAAIGLAGLSMIPSRLGEIDPGESSAAGRVEAWYAGLQMLFSKPILGVGKGLFTEHNYLTAHNSFVLVFAELGLVGYFFWLALVGLSVLMVCQISSAPDRLSDSSVEWNQHKKIAGTYVYSMLGFFVAAFFLSRSYNIVLFVMCALCVALYQCVRTKCPSFDPITLKKYAARIFVLEISSIIFMYILVKILLILGD